MTKEEQIEITRDAVRELEERRDTEDSTLHNVPMAAFNDTRATLASLQTTVSFFRTFVESRARARAGANNYSRSRICTSARTSTSSW